MPPLADLESAAQLTQAAAAYPAVVLHFWATWCEPCKQMDVVLAQLASENPHAGFFRVEAESVPELAEKYEVEAVPFFVIIKNGVVAQKVEGADAPALAAAVATHVKTAAAPAAAAAAPPAAAPTVVQRIEALLSGNDLLLFMKGDKVNPRCGFSRKVVGALQETGLPFSTFDILEDEAIRQGLKEYSNWPTYPQLYAKGTLLGGCDVVLELHEAGELKGEIEEALGKATAAAVAPTPAPTPAPAPAAAPPAESKEELTKRIAGLVQRSPVMLFMKGDKEAPRCGFSSKVVAALKNVEVNFDTFDILSDEAVRQGLKEYSNWPTYPQLYVKGEMLGGCDIVLEMAEGGELKSSIEELLAEA